MSSAMQHIITQDMIVAALDAYWGKRPRQRRSQPEWPDKALMAMHDAIIAALEAAPPPSCHGTHGER
jgi:hypothetical protein